LNARPTGVYLFEVNHEPARIRVQRFFLDAAFFEKTKPTRRRKLVASRRRYSGRLEPEITSFALADVFAQMKVEFEPLARSKGLELRIVETSTWVDVDALAAVVRPQLTLAG